MREKSNLPVFRRRGALDRYIQGNVTSTPYFIFLLIQRDCFLQLFFFIFINLFFFLTAFFSMDVPNYTLFFFPLYGATGGGGEEEDISHY